MKQLRNLFLMLGLLALNACSEDTAQSYNVDDAQQIYNQMKGTYNGTVMVNNLPTALQIYIASDFTVKYLPTYPILSHVFTSSGELEEAVNSMEKVTFTAQTDNMGVGEQSTVLTLKPSDLVFNVKVGGKEKEVVVSFQTIVYRDNRYGNLTVNIQATELYCDGTAYSLKDNGIVYFVDCATKVSDV